MSLPAGPDLDAKVYAYRLVAYSVLSFSLVSVLAVVVTLPFLYHYAQSLREQHSQGRELCEVSKNCWGRGGGDGLGTVDVGRVQ